MRQRKRRGAPDRSTCPVFGDRCPVFGGRFGPFDGERTRAFRSPLSGASAGRICQAGQGSPLGSLLPSCHALAKPLAWDLRTKTPSTLQPPAGQRSAAWCGRPRPSSHSNWQRAPSWPRHPAVASPRHSLPSRPSPRRRLRLRRPRPPRPPRQPLRQPPQRRPRPPRGAAAGRAPWSSNLRWAPRSRRTPVPPQRTT